MCSRSDSLGAECVTTLEAQRATTERPDACGDFCAELHDDRARVQRRFIGLGLESRTGERALRRYAASSPDERKRNPGYRA
jgi:hypothetical protein